MGYTTNFRGKFNLDKPLTEAHAAYLKQFSATRRMGRRADVAARLPDPLREAVGLPIGVEAAFFVGGTGMAGQDHDPSIIDYDRAPKDQPGLWCQWVPTHDLKGIKWDGGERFYDYAAWLQYLLDSFLLDWGYTLSGTVEWRGEDLDDMGSLTIVDGGKKVAATTTVAR